VSPQHLVEHYFRHEYGRLVAMLARRVGVQHIEAVEDAVQSALMVALEAWKGVGLPDNPSAWLFRVAHNHLIGELRQQARRGHILQRAGEEALAPQPDLDRISGEDGQEDLLRMLFVCCDDAIPVESQLVLALKTLCGFAVEEIAQRLLTSPANIYKRLGRARMRLRERPLRIDELSPQQYTARLSAVHSVLYILFTEGYLSSHPQLAIRRELCAEAIRLATILAERPQGQAPATSALLALMYLHLARMTTRQDSAGGLLLLEEQDRERWDVRMIECGLCWLADSARGDSFSRYHAEAGVAAEHCLAPSFAQTRWDKIAEYYALLEQLASSPLHRLNRAVAVAEWRGPAAGLAVLAGFEPPSWLTNSYQWAAVLADLHRRCGNLALAQAYQAIAYAGAPTPAIQQLLERRLMSAGPCDERT
jgi:RNA polymerase sigma factor (sigma-70 family)